MQLPPLMSASFPLAVSLVFCTALSSLSAAVITDPALTTKASGTVPIDPTGSREVNIELGNISKAALNVSSIASMQNWAGFSGSTNIVNFTAASQPDFRFAIAGTNVSSQSGSQTNLTSGTASVTSGASGMTLSGLTTPSSGSLTLTIDVGSYDTGTQVFTTGTVGLATVAFTLSNVRGGITLSADFYSSSGLLTSLGPQSGTNSTVPDGGAGNNILFAYQGDGTAAHSVTQIVITRTWTNNPSSVQGLDDFGFIAVPEPETWAMAGLGSLLLAGVALRRGRRASAT